MRKAGLMNQPARATVVVKKDWLHTCGHTEYSRDTPFLVLKRFKVSGFDFYDVQVPWQEAPWTVAEWRIVGYTL